MNRFAHRIIMSVLLVAALVLIWDALRRRRQNVPVPSRLRINYGRISAARARR